MSVARVSAGGGSAQATGDEPGPGAIGCGARTKRLGQMGKIARGVFFIVGTGRCGSTLLQAMLSAHPRLCVPRETHFFLRFTPEALGLPDPLPDGDAAREYARRVRLTAWWETLGVDSAWLDGIAEDPSRSRDTGGMFLDLLERLTPSDRPGVRMGEKSPQHVRHIGQIAGLFPRARFIHLVRDPRDVTESLLRMPWWEHRREVLGDAAVHATARAWRRCVERADQALKRLGPQRLMHVRYEDLVRAPEPTLRTVCAFLGETFEVSMLDHPQHGTAGFSSREEAWKGGTRAPIDANQIGKSRGRLSARDVWAIEHHAGAWLSRMGYELDPHVPRPALWRARCWWEARRAFAAIRRRHATPSGSATPPA
jgi:hypothetical protein